MSLITLVAQRWLGLSLERKVVTGLLLPLAALPILVIVIYNGLLTWFGLVTGNKDLLKEEIF